MPPPRIASKRAESLCCSLNRNLRTVIAADRIRSRSERFAGNRWTVYDAVQGTYPMLATSETYPALPRTAPISNTETELVSNAQYDPNQSLTYPAVYVIFTLLKAVRRGIEQKHMWREFRQQGIALKLRLSFWIALCRAAGLL